MRVSFIVEIYEGQSVVISYARVALSVPEVDDESYKYVNEQSPNKSHDIEAVPLMLCFNVMILSWKRDLGRAMEKAISKEVV